MYRRVDSIFRQREMNAFVVLLMSLLLMSLLVVSAAGSGGQHCASKYRLAKYNDRESGKYTWLRETIHADSNS